MKCNLWAWGQLKRGADMLALGERCFEGMGRLQGGFRFRRRPKYVLREWVELQRGLEVLALDQRCSEGMGH